MAKYEAFKWLDGTREIKTRIVSAISSHYSRRHWFVFHIGTKYWFCTFVMHVCQIQSLHPIHTHTHPYLVQEQLWPSRRFLQWHLGLVQVCGTFSRFHSSLCLYSKHYWSTVSHCHRENVESQEWQRRTRSWVHVKSRVHRVECLPGEKRLVQSNSSVLGLSHHHHRPEDWAE